MSYDIALIAISQINIPEMECGYLLRIFKGL